MFVAMIFASGSGVVCRFCNMMIASSVLAVLMASSFVTCVSVFTVAVVMFQRAPVVGVAPGNQGCTTAQKACSNTAYSTPRGSFAVAWILTVEAEEDLDHKPCQG